jgi:hypothetical protein
MLRTVGDQASLWESILPEVCLGMPAELAAVDRMLDDERFFAPYRAFFHGTIGRPSIPIETYLRLMLLEYRSSSASSRCVERWRTRSRGGGSAGSGWAGRCRTRRR